MTARPSGAFASLPRARPSAIGTRAKKAARAVITTGRTRIDAALRIASVGRQALLHAQVLGEVDQQHRVRHHDADHEDHAQQRLHVDRRAGHDSISTTPTRPTGTADRITSGVSHDLNRATIRK